MLVVNSGSATPENEQRPPRPSWHVPLRRKFITYVKTLDPSRLVFLDEAGSHIAMTRDYGGAPRGERVHGSVPRNRGEVTTMIGALDVRGMRALMTVGGGTDADVFDAFVEKVLVCKPLPGDIVVLDNVGTQQAGANSPTGRGGGSPVALPAIWSSDRRSSPVKPLSDGQLNRPVGSATAGPAPSSSSRPSSMGLRSGE